MRSAIVCHSELQPPEPLHRGDHYTIVRHHEVGVEPISDPAISGAAEFAAGTGTGGLVHKEDLRAMPTTAPAISQKRLDDLSGNAPLLAADLGMAREYTILPLGGLNRR